MIVNIDLDASAYTIAAMNRSQRVVASCILGLIASKKKLQLLGLDNEEGTRALVEA